ncbi:uncharacterized protein isoform X2 [Takifugu rubripes]|uniref:uncharacterized protein isoform X2 n=1 Tax=Takifugu rubripes TaxID=31033 RepID=UPI00114535A2|nr:uncharacterized protein LOC101079236 isoform X2 [Takifugu rubripes]
MEHNAIQCSGAPSCQRGSYAFYKSVSSRVQPDGPPQLWKLGEFYFIRCGPQDPVCIAEVTLLWEDRTQRHLLASTRLYFLPEDTPKGRTREHGEDEVLAVSRKMVVRVEDLVRWSCVQPSCWSRRVKAASCGTNGIRRSPQAEDSGGGGELLKDKTENDLAGSNGVKVLSYPQYCRFRSLQRRILDSARGPGLQDPHLLALGGIKALPNTRLMYCRDTFSHPALESSTEFSWQFRCPSLSLRGRPRKRRGQDDKESPTCTQSESWIERMKVVFLLYIPVCEENVMGSVEAGCEGGWLPHPEEQLFLDQLYAFMDRQGSPIHKVPHLGFKKIDLFLMYSVVKRLGGYRKVTLDRLWKVVYNELGGCPGSTSAATCTRRHYERLMLPYEEHLRAGGAEFKIPESPSLPKARGIRGRKPHPRGRKPGAKAKEKRITTPAASPSAGALASSQATAKRGRGRPPGTRNKTTLMAEAKLLSQQQIKAKAAAESPVSSGTNKPIQPAILPISMPLTPELSPLSATMLPFQPKPKELKTDLLDPVSPPPAGLILSAFPRHFVGGSLGGFSPIKGVCPLDVFKSRMSLQRNLESPALTPQDPAKHLPTIYTLQPTGGSPDTPRTGLDQTQPQPLSHQKHNEYSGCNAEDGVQKAGNRDIRNRPLLPPLRVLPLNLDCSVQVNQLMRTRLGSSQFQTFTRRLSEALSQDLGAKPPCAPITPPPEQALPLNLSKRFTTKRPGAPDAGDPSPVAMVGNEDQPSSKRAKTGCPAQAEDFGQRSLSASAGTGGAGQNMKNQEEPADLSSPSRIRAFLLGLPPFQVKFEEDLNGTRFGKLLAPGSKVEPQRTQSENAEGIVAVRPEQVEVAETEMSNKRQKCEQEEKEPLSPLVQLS